MNRPLFPTLAAVLALGATAFADIAPATHVGQNITTVNAPGIRMVSAKVDITWGKPGELSATFLMNNETDAAAAVQVGFPVPMPDEPVEGTKLGFTMAFDGIPADPADIQQGTLSKDEHSFSRSVVWYHCRHTFPPGACTVKVNTKLPVSLSYLWPYRSRLYYCIQTNAAWKGTIGSEEVAIHFPAPVPPEQIARAEPAFQAIKGDTVIWQFTDFEPKDGDHDIKLEFLNPDVLPVLDDLRKQAAAAPDDPGKELVLIKHLLALTHARYAFPYPPREMPEDEYREIVGMLRTKKDRASFQSKFAKGDDGLYREKNDDWLFRTDSRKASEAQFERKGVAAERDSREINEMLSAVGYVPRYIRSDGLTEGRDRLARLLKKHPHDADAWKVCLVHFAGLKDEAFGFYPYQIKLVRDARRNCPDDDCLRLWDVVNRLEQRCARQRTREFTSLDRQVSRAEDRLEKMLEAQGLFTLRYREPDGTYFMEPILDNSSRPEQPE